MKILLRYFIIAAALTISLNSNAITIYEISYEFKGNTDFPKYTAFLVRYGNGTGFMRVKYFNKAFTETYVVNMEFDEAESRSKINGKFHLTLQFKGKNPQYIINTSKDKTKEAYNPDLLWFKKLPSETNFVPWGVTSLNTDGTYEQGRIISMKLMNTSDLTKAYVRSYFLETESFYANLFSPQGNTVSNPTTTNPTTTPVTTPAVTNAKIHFIVVAATDDPRIGSSVAKDVTNFYSQIKDVSVFLNLPLVYTEIKGSKFGKASVETALNNLNPSANDIVIFYYSGHGYSNPQNSTQAYPQFDLRQSRFDDITVATLNASDVYNRIKAKNARLNLIITDCCNSNLGLLKPEGKNFAQTAKSLMTWEKSFCYDLFMKSKGSILATAAKKGQYAYGNTDLGGYFTSNIITAMEKHLSKFQNSSPTWDSIIAEAQSATVSLSMSNLCAATTSCRQDPVYLVDVRK
jgi:Caspase domain